MATPARRGFDVRLLNRALQGGVLAVLVAGVVVGNVSVVVNAGLGFLVTLLPAALERDLSIRLDPRHTLWVTGTVLLHAVGILGPYHSVWWWDHLTHVLAAGVVAAATYVAVAAVDHHLPELYLPPRFLFAFSVLATLAAGVLWEVLEFGARVTARATGREPVLVQYGLEDTMWDLVFDGLGAVLVAALHTRTLRSLAATIAARFEDLRES